MNDGNENGGAPPTGGTTPPTGGTPPTEPKVLTQEQVDKIVQERVAKTKTQLESATALLKQFQDNKSIGEEQQKALQQQLDHMQRSLLTKEELSAKEKKELKEELENRLKQTEAQASTWKARFEDSTIKQSIFDVAREEAFDPQQFIDFLSPKTKLIEEVVEGKPTGRFVPTISFLGQDKDGNPVNMELSPADTIKEMKKMTTKYGNLFKSGLNGGVGGNNAGGSGKELSDADLADHDAYMKHREKLKS